MAKGSIALEELLRCSKREFLDNGYKNASLRNIAATAGLTTGAIYGYFKSKDAIFRALVTSVCEKTRALFCELSEGYVTADGAPHEINVQKSLDDLKVIYTFIYNNFDEFRLLICCAEGSSCADFVHSVVECEIAYTKAYLDKLKQAKNADFTVDEAMLHILCDSYINALLEPVRHNMSYEEALRNVKFLCMFFTGGWETVIGSLMGDA